MDGWRSEMTNVLDNCCINNNDGDDDDDDDDASRRWPTDRVAEMSASASSFIRRN